jgi:hypothetical protein
MRDWLKRHPAVTAALALVIGLPGVVVGALVLMLVFMWTLQTRVLPAGAPISPWSWAVAFALTCVPMWFLVRFCARLGGWAGLGLGLGAVAVVAAGFWVLGSVEQALQPDNGMAGVGSGILTYILGLFDVVALLMGAVMLKWGGARRQEAQAQEL